MRFIDSQPHRGARVREVTTEELGQIYPVRAALEEVAGREAASRLTDEQLQELADELDGMAVAAAAGDIHAQLVHDTRFHEIIVEASGNQVVVDVWRSLRVEARTLVSVLKSESDLSAIAELHRPVLQALQFRDPELAGKEMRAHIEFFGAWWRVGLRPIDPPNRHRRRHRRSLAVVSDDVRRAPAVDATSTIADRTIDLTATEWRTGRP